MRPKEFIKDLKKLITEYWIEVSILIVFMAIVFEILRKIFIWIG
jgi:hypothetical protein